MIGGEDGFGEVGWWREWLLERMDGREDDWWREWLVERMVGGENGC